MWRVWRPVFGWTFLCPIKFSDPIGIVIVMPRATQPVAWDEVEASWPDYYPDITAECKTDDFGRIDGRIFALDYGCADADMVRQQRRYYAEKAAGMSAPTINAKTPD